MTQRTDIFRPSAIKPEEFTFIGVDNVREDSFEFIVVQEERERIRHFIHTTGARFSSHKHAGNCHVCGAHCIFTAVFHHRPTNKLIKTGFDCAEKFHLCQDGEVNLFKNFRKAVGVAEEARAGKIKAQRILEGKNLTRAWELFQEGSHDNWQDHDTLIDIVGKLVRWGGLSDAQFDFLKTLVERLDNWAKVQEEREAAKKVSQHLGEAGEFLSFEGTIDFKHFFVNQWGEQGITTLVDDQGNKVTLFRDLALQGTSINKGARVSFEGKVKEHSDFKGENRTVIAGRLRKLTIL
jgi:hypothetical protein